MKYSVVFEKDADKQLQKIDPTQQRLIVNWISKNLEDTENPRVHRKFLRGNLLNFSINLDFTNVKALSKSKTLIKLDIFR